jgi:N-acyl-D-amino-acid deacylase
MAEFDTLIKGGIIVDGARVPRYRADVAVKDGRIARIGRLRNASAASILDADGLIVAPGAIDLHTPSICIRTTTRRSTGIPTARLTAGTV